MRIILYTGKGGVGKTSIAAATGLRLAELGYNTLVMSIDPAHSLSDAFDLDGRLTEHGGGRPVRVRDNLAIQEILIQEEIERYWKEVYSYITTLLKSAGIEEIAAEELAIFPGMEEICSLLYINEYAREGTYDVVLLDCAPTGESLRFISLPTTLDWYMKKVFHLERNMLRVARPIMKKVASLTLPEDEYFNNVENLFQRLEGIDAILHDPKQTTVRLVTNPEKMVLKETQRAFMYFCLYGLTIDAVIVNRILPTEADGAFISKWRDVQRGYLEDIDALFAGVPIWRVPMFMGEVLGLDGLEQLSGALYGASEIDPAEAFATESPIHFSKENGEYQIRLRLPYVKATEIELSVFSDELIVQVGGMKRHVALPRYLMGAEPSAARRRGDSLEITFPATMPTSSS